MIAATAGQARRTASRVATVARERMRGDGGGAAGITGGGGVPWGNAGLDTHSHERGERKTSD